jgi:hypothetical protein
VEGIEKTHDAERPIHECELRDATKPEFDPPADPRCARTSSVVTTSMLVGTLNWSALSARRRFTAIHQPPTQSFGAYSAMLVGTRRAKSESDLCQNCVTCPRNSGTTRQLRAHVETHRRYRKLLIGNALG